MMYLCVADMYTNKIACRTGAFGKAFFSWSNSHWYNTTQFGTTHRTVEYNTKYIFKPHTAGYVLRTKAKKQKPIELLL